MSEYISICKGTYSWLHGVFLAPEVIKLPVAYLKKEGGESVNKASYYFPPLKPQPFTTMPTKSQHMATVRVHLLCQCFLTDTDLSGHLLCILYIYTCSCIIWKLNRSLCWLFKTDASIKVKYFRNYWFWDKVQDRCTDSVWLAEKRRLSSVCSFYWIS